MDTLKAELAKFQTTKDLRAILGLGGPCLSVYVPLSPAPANQGNKANGLEWKETLRALEAKLAPHGSQGRELLQSISDWEAVVPDEEPQGKSIAVFRSPEVFRVSWVEDAVKSRADVGPHFYIRPLLADVTRDRTFYLLALSQNDVRMLRCTTHSSEEVPFPPGIENSFDAWMNTAKPDHNLNMKGSVSATSGNQKGVLEGTTTGAEDWAKYLGHFYKQIDRGVNDLLRGHTEPLVMAAVEYEIPVYREANSYPHLAEEAVQGAPNGLKAGEMHARALAALERCYEKKLDEILAQYDHRVGGGASNRLKDVVTAAHDGRVLTLVVSDSLEQTGSFNEATHSVKGRETGTPEDEDLVNDAAVQTILHAGQVYVAPTSKMPNGAALAAIYRF
jgi:hypothetical protein